MIDSLVLLLVLLQLADAVLTRLIIKSGGREMNPLLVRLDQWLREEFETGARWAWLAVAKGVAIAAILGAYVLGAWHTPEGGVLLGALMIYYAMVVRHNWREYREVKS